MDYSENGYFGSFFLADKGSVFNGLFVSNILFILLNFVCHRCCSIQETRRSCLKNEHVGSFFFPVLKFLCSVVFYFKYIIYHVNIFYANGVLVFRRGEEAGLRMSTLVGFFPVLQFLCSMPYWFRINYFSCYATGVVVFRR